MAELIPGVGCGFCCGLLCGLAHGDEDSSYFQSRTTTRPTVNQYAIPVQQQSAPAFKSHKTVDLVKTEASRPPSENLQKSNNIIKGENSKENRKLNGELNRKETTAPPNETIKKPNATELSAPNEAKSPSPKATKS